MPATDPLAAERFRTIVTDALCEDPDVSVDFPALTAEPVLQRFPDAHFEYRTNEHGVHVRRVVVAGTWEVDPTGIHCEGCGKPMPEELRERRGHFGCIKPPV